MSLEVNFDNLRRRTFRDFNRICLKLKEHRTFDLDFDESGLIDDFENLRADIVTLVCLESEGEPFKVLEGVEEIESLVEED